MPWTKPPSIWPMSSAGFSDLPTVVQDVDPLDPVLAGQRVDRDLAAGRAIGEVVERPAACRWRGPSGSWASCRSRSRRARPGPCRPARPAPGTGSPGCRPGPGSGRNTTCSRGHRPVLGGEVDQPLLDRARRRQRRHAVEVGAGGGGGGRGVGHLAGGGGGDPHLVEVDLELLGHDLRHLGVEPLPHLGAAMVQVHAAVGVDVHQRAGLVVGGQR